MEMNQAQQFVYLRTYSRWIESEKRRERSWSESADRYFDFMKGKYLDKVPKKIWKLAEQRVKDFGTMPSMRALWSAGPALERNNIAAFNCCYLPFVDLRSVAELCYILMNGSGVGFSVEHQYIDKMPVVAKQTSGGIGVFTIEDSKEGWAEAVYAGLETWFSGQDVEFDYSRIRPRGARLKTFGGRASGPDPLRSLLDFIRTTVIAAQGRQLTDIEWTDIGNKCGEVVVSGGVRRSSEINFSDLDSDAMRFAKSGAFPVHRFMSNNSAVYHSKPTSTEFMKEWLALAESGRGERGIFNLSAIEKRPKSRRKFDSNFRTNPCVTGDTIVLTEEGPREVFDLIGKEFQAVVNGKSYHSGGFWKTGDKNVYEVVTAAGYRFKATDDHEVLTLDGWKKVMNLDKTDSLVLNQNSPTNSWGGIGVFDQGWLLGEIVGDGGFNPEKYGTYLRFWGDSARQMAIKAKKILNENFDTDSDENKTAEFGPITVMSYRLDSFAAAYLEPATKNFTGALETETSSAFVCGFLSGFFDADGTVLVNHKKGHSIRLSQSNLPKLWTVQRMLARFGIKSTVYENRITERAKQMPDGKGGNKLYHCLPNHELVISNDSIEKFATAIGFQEPQKKAALSAIVATRKRTPNKTNYFSGVESVTLVGEEPVYDCTVEDVHCFDANGVIVHNCGEILLKPFSFCNLTEIVVRPTDTFDDLIEKAEVAVWLGAMQAGLTDFHWIRPEFKKNCDEEALLGVSITGQMDNVALMIPEYLKVLKEYVLKTAKKACKALGINYSVAITTGKPSGTVSQLVQCGSGAHPWHDKYYIRRYRISSTDPLYAMMAAQGVLFTPEVGQRPIDNEKKRAKLLEEGWTEEQLDVGICPKWSPDHVNTWVVDFPIKAPEGAVTRNEVDAIAQLEWYLKFMRNYIEHNQSITIYVKDNEWLKVGAWVYDHFDEIVGVSFLPYDGGHYELAPYESITKEQYDELVAKMVPIDWTQLDKYEEDDNTTGAQSLACVGYSCELT